LKFYIGSKLSNKKNVTELANYLLAKGLQVTYDWTSIDIRNDNVDKIKPIVHLQIAGIGEADVVIIMLPGGRGTHVELGIAIGLKKPIILCCDDANSYFDSAYYSYNHIIKSTCEFDSVYELIKTINA